MAVKVFAVNFNGNSTGYDVEINSKSASVKDYLDSINDAVERLRLSRAWKDTDKCYGCDLCCGKRIPLTSVDVESLLNVPFVFETMSCSRASLSEEDLRAKFIKRFCRVYVSGRLVDITLRLDFSGKCIFLDKDTSSCLVYPHRPFVCQTFICCPAKNRAAALREAVANAGEDELVRMWLQYITRNSLEVWYDEADEPRVSLEDWVEGPFTGKSDYSDILLKDVLPASLWKKLYTG